MNDLHGIIFAYRSDANLGELTRPRNTCSLPFGGRYRLIDFMLSNLCERRHHRRGPHRPRELSVPAGPRGLGKDWELSRKHGGLRILPPFGYGGQRRRRVPGQHGGPVRRYPTLQNIRQDYVILAWGRRAVNLPVAQIFQQHLDTALTSPGVQPQLLRHLRQLRVRHPGPGRPGERPGHPPLHRVGLESLEVYVMSKERLLEIVGVLHHPQYLQLQPRRAPAPPPRAEDPALRPPGLRGPLPLGERLLQQLHGPAQARGARRPVQPRPAHPHQGPVQPLHLLRPRRHLPAVPGGRRLLHRGRGGELHPLPRGHRGGGGQGVQQRPHAGHRGQGRRLPVLCDRGQERENQRGPRAHGHSTYPLAIAKDSIV